MIVPVLKAAICSLVHVPEVVRHGSKPARELPRQPGLEARLAGALRDHDAAVRYAPNQAFIGNRAPEELWELPGPWFTHLLADADATGPWGEIVDQAIFYALLKLSDDFQVVALEQEFLGGVADQMAAHPLGSALDLKRLEQAATQAEIERGLDGGQALPLYHQGRLIGCVRAAHAEDASLTAEVLLENLAAKATGALAALQLWQRFGIAPTSIDYALSCSEDAVGDRYNRGGGNLAKAIAELAGCLSASGSDIKAFCSAPIHATVIAASLVSAGVFENVLVVGGGSLPKLGMKFLSHLDKQVPILEDTLGAIAFVVSRDDGVSPVIRTDLVGRHAVGSGSSQQAILEALVVQPLERAGLRITDVDKFATEMHNPEITIPADRGDVPRSNYRMIGALAARRGEIAPGELEGFVRRHGLPGFSPTQGHIPSAVPYLPHARKAMLAGTLGRAMFIGKGSLFLGRMTNLSDGMSFVLERNPAAAPGLSR